MALLGGAGLVLAGTLSGIGLAHAAAPAPLTYSCDRGVFCFWDHAGYRGDARLLDLRTVNPGDCVPLGAGFRARSFANRSRRALTVYANATCDSQAEHLSYPGGGTFVPRATFPVAALSVGGNAFGSVTPAAVAVSDSRFPTGDIDCPDGLLCYWPQPGFPGTPRTIDPGRTPHGRCVTLAFRDEARSFVNNTGKPATLYQGGHCSPDGAFATYPGGGTYVPDAPFVARAVEIWER